MTYFIKNNDARVSGCLLELETIAGRWTITKPLCLNYLRRLSRWSTLYILLLCMPVNLDFFIGFLT